MISILLFKRGRKFLVAAGPQSINLSTLTTKPECFVIVVSLSDLIFFSCRACILSPNESHEKAQYIKHRVAKLLRQI